MAVRSSCAASSKMAMEKNVDLVRLEGRIYASISESRERLLRMQVLRGVLDHERMLLRISAQERDMESVKKEQRRLQEEVSELKSLCARLQRDSDPAPTSEVSWTQLQNRLQSFVDSPLHQLPSTGDPPGAVEVSKVEASASAVITGTTQEGHQLSVGVSCEGGTPFSDAAVFVVPQRRGRRPGRGRGGRRGGATRGGRRGGRGRQQNPPTPQLSKKFVVGDGELVNLDMLGVLGLLGSDCAGPSGGVTREELRRAEEEESPLSLVPAESSVSVEERQRVDGTVSGGPGTQEEGGADEGGIKNDKCDRRNDEGDRSSIEGDRKNAEGDRRSDEGDRSNEDDKKSDVGDRQNDEDDKKSDKGDRQNDEDDKKSDEGDRQNDEGDRRSDEGDRSNEDDRKSDKGDRQNDEDVEKSDEVDRQNDEVDRRNDEDDKIAGEDASKADQGDSSVGEGGRSDDGDPEDREGSDGKKGDSTVLMADSVGVAQELPVGEQHEEMVVTLSATATPPVSGRDPRTAALGKLDAGSGVSGEGGCDEVRCEPPTSKPGKRRGRPPKDDSKRKKTEDSSGDVENGIAAHVDQSGTAAAVLDACEEVSGAPAPSQKGRRRKTISKLQSSFLPDVPAFAQPLSKATFTWKGFRAPMVKCNPPKLLRIPKEQR